MLDGCEAPRSTFGSCFRCETRHRTADEQAGSQLIAPVFSRPLTRAVVEKVLLLLVVVVLLKLSWSTKGLCVFRPRTNVLGRAEFSCWRRNARWRLCVLYLKRNMSFSWLTCSLLLGTLCAGKQLLWLGELQQCCRLFVLWLLFCQKKRKEKKTRL